ncbi:CMGC kinase, Dyrk family, putative [Eimeria maxima]|uniref:CMGC kinase, Dyrk family, putative n=1 Tax=Eimeria maxima TaxID=5804 RepID=U6MGA9_EIMMA|nr:CMGC kinase, Dyrk family, putative [Eimeria maxima]CDJ60680.1 CMGC kinase, Dyrk family, putative [Eimeria maxima]
MEGMGREAQDSRGDSIGSCYTPQSFRADGSEAPAAAAGANLLLLLQPESSHPSQNEDPLEHADRQMLQQQQRQQQQQQQQQQLQPTKRERSSKSRPRFMAAAAAVAFALRSLQRRPQPSRDQEGQQQHQHWQQQQQKQQQQPLHQELILYEGTAGLAVEEGSNSEADWIAKQKHEQQQQQQQPCQQHHRQQQQQQQQQQYGYPGSLRKKPSEAPWTRFLGRWGYRPGSAAATAVPTAPPPTSAATAAVGIMPSTREVYEAGTGDTSGSPMGAFDAVMPFSRFSSSTLYLQQQQEQPEEQPQHHEHDEQQEVGEQQQQQHEQQQQHGQQQHGQEHRQQHGQHEQREQQDTTYHVEQQGNLCSIESFLSVASSEDMPTQQLPPQPQQLVLQFSRCCSSGSEAGALVSAGETFEEDQAVRDPAVAAAKAEELSVIYCLEPPVRQQHQQQEEFSVEEPSIAWEAINVEGSSSTRDRSTGSSGSSGNSSSSSASRLAPTNLFESTLRAEDSEDEDSAAESSPPTPAVAVAHTQQAAAACVVEAAAAAADAAAVMFEAVEGLPAAAAAGDTEPTEEAVAAGTAAGATKDHAAPFQEPPRSAATPRKRGPPYKRAGAVDWLIAQQQHLQHQLEHQRQHTCQGAVLSPTEGCRCSSSSIPGKLSEAEVAALLPPTAAAARTAAFSKTGTALESKGVVKKVQHNHLRVPRHLTLAAAHPLCPRLMHTKISAQQTEAPPPTAAARSEATAALPAFPLSRGLRVAARGPRGLERPSPAGDVSLRSSNYERPPLVQAQQQLQQDLQQQQQQATSHKALSCTDRPHQNDSQRARTASGRPGSAVGPSAAAAEDAFEDITDQDEAARAPAAGVFKGSPPLSAIAVLQQFGFQLTPWERSEILEYPIVFYWGSLRKRPAGTERASIYGGPAAAAAAAEGRALAIALGRSPNGMSQSAASRALLGGSGSAAFGGLAAKGSRRSSTLSRSNGQLINATNDSARSYFCDAEGDYVVFANDHICYRFQLLQPLGTGSFGRVFRAFDHKTGEEVALKILKNKSNFHAQGREEVDVLQQLSSLNRDGKAHIVRLRESHMFRGHLVLAFELLSHNLYSFLQSNKFRGFEPLAVRSFAVQLLRALRLLKRAQIVHCDLKPENIALVAGRKSIVKLIDFGSSCREGRQQHNAYIQSRYYRAPEILLGLPYGPPIDMWSLGCVLAELHTGTPLFPGVDEEDQLQTIASLLGLPPTELILRAPRSSIFFQRNAHGSFSFLNARSNKRTDETPSSRRSPCYASLEDAVKPAENAFVDFLKGCLRWDATDRLTPREALQHPWLQELRAPRERHQQ